jgi:hypothetical protein
MFFQIEIITISNSFRRPILKLLLGIVDIDGKVVVFNLAPVETGLLKLVLEKS